MPRSRSGSAAWRSAVFSSDLPQSKTLSRAARSGDPGASAWRARCLPGSAPPSHTSATEEPIHIWGTGISRASTQRAASCRIMSKRTYSLYSVGVSTDSPSASACSDRSAKSTQCRRNSGAFRRWRVKRRPFFPSLMHGHPPGSPSCCVRSPSPGLSKPSSRKPCLEEFVILSTTSFRRAALRDLPCQPATAVLLPILMSSIRQVARPSRRFFKSSSSRGFGSSLSPTMHLALKMPP
mmetsp:Transcript_5895/g.16761  ORF Transcript_5895/g.16761 Transcript_5895/m.16761 type:complete len:237 (+) Transcript_5895:951-1661(+)